MGNCANISNANNPRSDKIKKNNSTNLAVKTYTWNRDSHGLFDYESKSIVKNQLKVPEPGFVFREKDDVKMTAGNQLALKQDESISKKLVSIEIRQQHYYIDSEYISNTGILSEDTNQQKRPPNFEEGIGEQCLWSIVKSQKTSHGQKGYELSVGDYLRLGRVRFRIKELQGLSTDPAQKEPNKLFYSQGLHILDMDLLAASEKGDLEKEETTSNTQMACRICLSDTEEEDNPFITPCKCDGTMKCIHVKCLQQWLKSRLHPKETAFSISFVWKTFDCELCKSPFPRMVKVKGSIFDTVEISRPSAPYVTLEILSKDRNVCKGIHVITLKQKNQIRLGRGHDSDIRISDISVSRCHAMLNYDQGMFWIEDNNSKFGTLALIKEPIQLNNKNNNIAIQVGRTVLSFMLKKNWKIHSVPASSQPQPLDQTKDTHFPANQYDNPVFMLEKKSTMNMGRVITAPSSMQQQQQQQLQAHKKNNKMDVADNEVPMSLQQLPTHLAPNRQNSNDNHEIENENIFQLPEFKDPAEELEQFQKEKEKEAEINILQRQLQLLKQHKNINEQNLATLMAVADESMKNVDEQSALQHRIQAYSIKISDIHATLSQLQIQQKDKKQQGNNLMRPDEIQAEFPSQ